MEGQNDLGSHIPQQNPYANPNLRPVWQEPVKLPPGLEAGIGLAVACFVLGLVSLLMSLFVVGIGAGLIGFILAVVHLGKRLPLKAMAATGLVLSILGVIAGTGFGVLYGISIYKTREMMQEMQSQQFEDYIGNTAPDINLTDLEGNKIVLSELQGKRVVLDFWATWCPPCRKEIPHFIELRSTSGPDELVIIGISSESVEVIKAFAEKQKINYPLVSMSDDKLPEPYSEIVSIPTTFFIDENGIIENVLTGYHSLEELKENALGRKEKAYELLPPETIKVIEKPKSSDE